MMKLLIILAGIFVGLGIIAAGWGFFESLFLRLLLTVFGYLMLACFLGSAVGKRLKMKQKNI